MENKTFWIRRPDRKPTGTYTTEATVKGSTASFISQDEATALELHDWLDEVTKTPSLIRTETAEGPVQVTEARPRRFDDILWNTMSPTSRELILRDGKAVIVFNIKKLGDIYVGTCNMTDDEEPNYIYAKPCNFDTEEECLSWVYDVIEAVAVLFDIRFDISVRFIRVGRA